MDKYGPLKSVGYPPDLQTHHKKNVAVGSPLGRGGCSSAP
jgi:hypothetical protein